VDQGRDREMLGWDGSLACPTDAGLSVSMGPVAGGGASRVPPCVPTCVGSGSVSIGATGGSRGASPVSPCMSPCAGYGFVAIAATGGCHEAGTSEGGPACARVSELDCAASRGWKSVRRVEAGGPSWRGGVWLWTGWKGCPQVAPLDGSVARPACAPSSRACSTEAGYLCGGGPP